MTRAARSDKRLANLRFGPPPTDPSEPDENVDRRWSDRRRVRRPDSEDPTVFVARYRFALLLGLGHQLSAEWWPTNEGAGEESGKGLRQDRLGDVRRSLANRMKIAYAVPISRMEEQFKGISHRVELEAEKYLEVNVESITDARERECRRAGVRLFFSMIGMWEVEHLISEQSIFRFTRGSFEDVTPRRSVELLLPRAILRLALAIGEINSDTRWLKKSKNSVLFAVDECVLAPGLTSLMDSGWPQSPDILVGWIREKFGRSGGIRTWHEHYNAACVIAILLEWHTGDAVRGIADAAVIELEKAVECGDGGFEESDRSWILDVDPDLDQLRKTEPFKDFKIYFLGRRQPEDD
ncbi:hypothetical protein [Actinomycetospora aeridis]|uniref:Uncharacterized protein n=1 Tax=Actinomycetospora aeridis TaxID=3129231 RepID=A0ABU8NA85_9PSEU